MTDKDSIGCIGFDELLTDFVHIEDVFNDTLKHERVFSSDFLGHLKDLKKKLELVELPSFIYHNYRVGLLNKTVAMIFYIQEMDK